MFDFLNEGTGPEMKIANKDLAIARFLAQMGQAFSPPGSTGDRFGGAIDSAARTMAFQNAYQNKQQQEQDKHTQMMELLSGYLTGDDDYNSPSSIKASGDSVTMTYPSMKKAAQLKPSIMTPKKELESNFPSNAQQENFLAGLSPEDIMALSKMGGEGHQINPYMKLLMEQKLQREMMFEQQQIGQSNADADLERNKHFEKYKADADLERDKQLEKYKASLNPESELDRQKALTKIEVDKAQIEYVKALTLNAANADDMTGASHQLRQQELQQSYDRLSLDRDKLMQEKIQYDEKAKFTNTGEDIIFDDKLPDTRRKAEIMRQNNNAKGNIYYTYSRYDSWLDMVVTPHEIPENAYLYLKDGKITTKDDADAQKIKVTRQLINRSIKGQKDQTAWLNFLLDRVEIDE